MPAMTIITWNCNMAFRKKAGVILKYKPDILVLQECEHTDKVTGSFGKHKPTTALWFGDNKHKGLAIFSFNGFELSIHKSHNSLFKFVVPLLVKKDNSVFNLFAIWAHNPADPDGQYITQVWKASKYYNRLIKKSNTILTGDFNSNSIWDKPRRVGNHSDLVNLLKRKKIHSAYHIHHNQQQGKEKHPTFWLYRHKNKPYHIDYCFVSADFMGLLDTVEVGTFKKWSRYSDHTPLIVSFNTKKRLPGEYFISHKEN